MIGNDPRYQAIINAYKSGEYNAPYQAIDYSPSPYYNPIYDIRTQQIAAGKLPAGARFPLPQLDTSQETPPASPETPIDPCPPGYQLVDGVCQPDTMFQQDSGRDKEPYTGPKITDGIIEGFRELEPTQQKMGTFYQSLSPEMKAEYDKASSYGRGIQFKTDEQGNVIRIVAKSPTLSQLAGDIAGGFGSMFGNVADAAMNYLGSGGLLGSIISNLFPQEPTITTGGSASSTVREFGPTAPVVPIDIQPLAPLVQIPGALDSTMRLQQEQQQAALLAQQQAAAEAERLRQLDIQRKTEAAAQAEKLRQQQALAAELEKQRQAELAAAAAQQAAAQKAVQDRVSASVPKAGTGASGAPGRNYSTPARSRAAQAASKLGTSLATRGR